jgi:Class III cytochrome C family
VRHARFVVWLCVAAAAAGCRGASRSGSDADSAAEPPEAPPPAPPRAGGAPAPAADVARPVASAPGRVTAATRFPHLAHAGVECRTCHATIPGHATHAAVACRECHTPPTVDATSTMPRDECRSCHHGAQQARECATCHAPVPPGKVERSLTLTVWKAPRTVSLPFDHARHGSLQCAACHQEPPALTPNRPCGSCHQNHHRPDADCASCHAVPPAGVHSLSVHEGCSGTGCHAATAVANLPQSRSACLVCHRDRTDHQPGKDCRSCHWPETGGGVQ